MKEREIFLTAMDIADADAREEFLDSVCGGDQKLHDRVVRLLQRSSSNDGFLESPASALVDALDPLNETQASDDGSATAVGGLETRTLGDFRILDEIGRGGMGVVYEAEQISLGRRVALKVLAYATILDKTKLDRFKIEARAAASLDHPNVVHVHSVGSRRGVHYYAMQFIEGHTVADLIADERRRRGPHNKLEQLPAVNGSSPDGPTEEFRAGQSSAVSGPEAVKDTDIAEGTVVATAGGSEEKERIGVVVKLGIQAAEALEHAHQMGIVHRDIKPSNLLVDGKQHLWVADFGLAMIEAEGNLTATGNLMGTFRYMSPEQVRGDRHVLDHHTDIYSLGATLYEMLTLRAAFPESDAAQLMQRIPIDEPTAPRKLNSAISRDLETIVLKAMAKNHDDRYATAAAMAADLKRCLHDEPIAAKPPGPLVRAKKWARRHRPVVGTAMGTLAIAVAIAGGLLWNERRETFAALDRETAQRELAEGESARAEDNLDLAMAALDTIYLDAIGRDKLLGQPVVANPDEKGDALQVKRTALTDLERDLLRRGLAFYDQFARQNQASPKAAVQTAQAFYRVALLQTAIGDSDDAKSSYQSSITRFQKLTEKHPDRSDYYQQLGEAYAGMSNVLPEWSDAKNALDKSRGAYARAIELDPEKAAYYLARGDIGMRLVDPSSLNDYERAIALDSQNVQLRLRLSRFYRNNTFGSRDRRKAIEHAEKALTLDPSNPECHLQLAAVLGKRTVTIDSNTRQTTESYSNAEQILDHYARAIELAPRQAKGYRERAGFYVRTGDYQRAIADIDHVLELHPEDRSALAKRASVYLSLGRPNEAIADLKAILAANPHNTGVYETLGMAYFAVKDWSAAVEAYSQYLERNPTRFHIYKRRAVAYAYQDEYEHALNDLRKSLSIHKNDTSALRWLPDERVISAPELFKQGLIQLAQEAVDRSTQPARAYGDRALMFMQLEDYEKASDDFLQATAAEPESASMNNNVAWILATYPEASIRDPERATKLANRAIELAPDAGAYWNTLGVAQYRNGQLLSAIESLMKSLELRDGGDALDFFFLAMAHWQLGNKAEARAWYDKSIKWMKDNEPTDEELVRFKAEAEETLGINSEAEASQDDHSPEGEKSPSQ